MAPLLLSIMIQIWQVTTGIGMYNHGQNILRLFNVLPNFPYTTSKRSMIISNKHGMYELPQNLAKEMSQKSQKFIELKPRAQSYYQNKNFANTSKNL